MKPHFISLYHRYAVPLVVEFNHETAQKIFKGLIKSHILFFMSKKADDYEANHEVIQGLAEKHRHKIQGPDSM